MNIPDTRKDVVTPIPKRPFSTLDPSAIAAVLSPELVKRGKLSQAHKNMIRVFKDEGKLSTSAIRKKYAGTTRTGCDANCLKWIKRVAEEEQINSSVTGYVLKGKYEIIYWQDSDRLGDMIKALDRFLIRHGQYSWKKVRNKKKLLLQFLKEYNSGYEIRELNIAA